MNSEEQTAKAYVRQYLTFISKALLICSAVFLAVDLFLPALSAIVALLLGLYLFVVVYHYLLFRPAIIQDVLFWITYAVFMGLTFIVLQGLCAAAPAISATCQPRLREGVFFFSRGFPATVTMIFWIIVRLMHIVKDRRQQAA